jgi:uncharacterized protein DUF1344
MRRALSITCGLLLMAGAAWAADIEGTVKSVDTTDRVIELQDGTRVYAAEGMPIEQIQEGAKVKLSYEERDGKNVATSVEVQ